MQQTVTPYENIYSLIFNPITHQFVYAAEKDGRPLVVEQNGTRRRFCRDRVERVVFTADGKEIVVCEQHKGLLDKGLGISWHGLQLVINGKKGKMYQVASAADIDPLLFSPDGKQIGLIASRRLQGNISQFIKFIKFVQFVVLNGQEGNLYREIRDVVFSADGASLAYVAESVEPGPRKVVMVINGREGEMYDYIKRPVFSPDGQSVGYGARKGNELWWIVDRVLQPKTDR